MKIYIVAHHYDNGKLYEDYCSFCDYYYFSTYEKGSVFYANRVLDDYEGMYRFFTVELDTQREHTIERSPWVDCSPIWAKGEISYPSGDEVYEEECECNPMYDWDYAYDTLYCYAHPVEDYFQKNTIKEYLNTPHTNYDEWKRCEDEILLRKLKAKYELEGGDLPF